MKFNHVTMLVFILILMSGINMTSFAAESQESDKENDVNQAIDNIITFYHTNYAADFGQITITHMSSDNNYYAAFEDEEKANLFSAHIGKSGIKGGRGNNKYVAKHYYSDHFGIILTSQNLETLHNKVKEVESGIK